MRENNRMNESTTGATQLFKRYEEKFEKLKGEPVIWQSFQNKEIRFPQLVMVEEALAHFVLVRKQCINAEGEISYIRYGVQYNALFCGVDTVETLDVSL